MLYEYAKQVQRLIRDSRQQDINVLDIYAHINAARREVAMRSQCIRKLTPISNQIVSATVTATGSGYTAPTIAISTPDFPSGQPPYPNGLQATALPILVGGSITAIDIQNGGEGYFQPSITIDDTTGSGAAATLSLGYINQINQGQEFYNWADIDLSMFPGVGSVYWIEGVAVLYSNWRYTPQYCSWSKYQAQVRTYTNATYQFVPAFYTQYGRGVDGSFAFYPPPSQTYQVEYDCLCTPIDLIDDNSEEAIPHPWRDAVKFYTAFLVMIDLQNHNSARSFLQLFDEYMKRYGAYSMPGRRQMWYGRPIP